MTGFEPAKYSAEIKKMSEILAAASALRAEVGEELSRLCLSEGRRKLAGVALIACAKDELRDVIEQFSRSLGFIAISDDSPCSD